ncbi:ABC transporter substrate-binding protein [Ramlibacter albus]|uniref:ABC transporter substrate-binding protein n=1 Tax=Ramlibacter albus TaxID=2079448 RepID=A0A923MG04_9BURK|nr:ABC transporter substrate-binding protein [Ramlibacter albus]MBC5768569.1 ABC transporter substrate-binding protein [Ramlibacter albus]
MSRHRAWKVVAFLFFLAGLLPRAFAAEPVLVGIDAEFGLQNSTSAQAVELGVRLAAAEINAAGGVLGRPLEIVTKDHRSIAARGIKNIEEFAADKRVVAVFGGRFSPVIIEQLPLLRQSGLPFLAVWSAADAIVDNGSMPNYVFRLSLRDSLAMPFMLRAAADRGLDKVGLLLTNTSWGRSNFAAAEKYGASSGRPAIVGAAWYNWQDASLVDRYRKLVDQGAKAIVLVANDDEAALLVREVAQLPAARRVPIISHWGITGGRFVAAAGPALGQVDVSVVQTFSFFKARPAPLKRFMETARRVAGIQRIEDIESPVGVAHAYDMTHLLAKAIGLAGGTERAAVRAALERLPPHDGLVRRYAPAFTAQRHEALDARELLLARYREDGVLVPAAR